jgi:hypothetical protein
MSSPTDKRPVFLPYTSGQLALHAPHSTSVVCAGSPKVQVFKAQGYPGSGYFPSPSEARANARRLVACWNACEGISTDAVEQIPNVMQVRQSYQTLKQQRDDLLDALKIAVRQGEHDLLLTGEELRAFRAVIDVVEATKS